MRLYKLLAIFILLVSVTFGLNTYASSRLTTLDSRSEWDGAFGWLTGDRMIYYARLDTASGRLYLESYTANRNNQNLRLKERRIYPLDNSNHLRIARQAMEAYELEWPLGLYFHLHEQDCRKVFFDSNFEVTQTLARDVSNIVSRLEAQDEDLRSQRLINIGGLCGNPPFSLNAVITRNNKFKRFMLESRDSRELSLTVRKAQNHVQIVDANGKVLIKLYMQDDSREGGKYTMYQISNCARNTYARYEFEFRKIVRQGRSQWAMTLFQKLDGLVSLAADDNPNSRSPVDSLSMDTDGVPDAIANIYLAFHTTNGKREVVRDSIVEKAGENPTVAQTLSRQQINSIADEVTRLMFDPNIEQFNSFRNLSLASQARKLSFYGFANAIVRENLREQIPPSFGHTEALVVEVNADLNFCLTSSDNAEEDARCMARFERSAPYRVGRVLLRYQMRDLLRSQEIRDAELNRLVESAIHHYDRCARSRYFGPYDLYLQDKAAGRIPMHAKPPFEVNKAIQGCVMSGLLGGVEETILHQARSTLAEQFPDDRQTASRLSSQSVNSYRNCIQRNRFITGNPEDLAFDYRRLESISPIFFERVLRSCAENVVVESGRTVVETKVRTNPTLIALTSSDPERLNQVARSTVEEGLNPCLERQREKDPGSCLPVIENILQRETIPLILRETIIAELGEGEDTNQALKASGVGSEHDDFNYQECLEERRSELLNGIQRNSTNTETPQNLACTRQAVSRLTPFIARKQYLQSIQEQEDLRDFAELRDPEWINQVTSAVANCIDTRTSDVSSLEEFSPALDRAKEACGLETTKQVISRVVSLSLMREVSAIEPNQERVSPLVEQLTQQFTESIRDLTTEDQVMTELNQFKANTTLLIAKQAIRWKVADTFPNNQELQQQITDEILREAAPAQWEEDLRRAVQDGNESQKNILLAQFKRRVALMLIERAIPERLKEHVPQEWARNSISEAIGKQFRKCLESFQDNHRQFDQKLDSCVTRATNSATYEVFRFRLGLALDEQFPTYKVTDQAEKSRNEAAKRAINTALMTRQLHTEVARANAAGPRALERFGLVFTARAGAQIAQVAAERELHNHFSVARVGQLRTGIRSVARQCFSQLEQQLQAGQNKNMDTEQRRCERQTTADVGWFILENKLKEELGVISGQTTRVNTVLTAARGAYWQCLGQFTGLSASDFETKHKSCINKSVLKFADKVAEQTLAYLSPVRGGSERALPAFRRCLGTIQSGPNVSTDAINSAITNCKNTQLTPNLFNEVKDHFGTLLDSNLDVNQRAVALAGIEILRPALEGKIQDDNASGDALSSLQDSLNGLAENLSSATRFSTEATRQGIEDVKRRVTAQLARRSTISTNYFQAQILASDLMFPILASQLQPVLDQTAREMSSGYIAVSNEDTAQLLGMNNNRWLNILRREVVAPNMFNGTPMDTLIEAFKSRHGDALAADLKAMKLRGVRDVVNPSWRVNFPR